jgi:ABC-2 type transport system permease protein
VTAFWRKLKAFADAGFASWSEYRAELYLWALAGVIPIIMMGVWRQTATRHDIGMSPSELTRYFLAVFMVRQLTMVWLIWEFEQQVVTGTLSPQLLQPIHPFWRFLVWHLTERVARTPFALALLLFWLWVFPDAVWLPSLKDLGLTALGVAAAFLARFVIQCAVATIAFWSERASSIEQLWFTVYMALSGMIAPLEMFPPSVRSFAELTPFPYMVYFPARILLGMPVDLLKGFAVLGAWSLAGFVVFRLLWRRGLRHYSAMGA